MAAIFPLSVSSTSRPTGESPSSERCVRDSLSGGDAVRSELSCDRGTPGGLIQWPVQHMDWAGVNEAWYRHTWSHYPRHASETKPETHDPDQFELYGNDESFYCQVSWALRISRSLAHGTREPVSHIVVCEWLSVEPSSIACSPHCVSVYGKRLKRKSWGGRFSSHLKLACRFYP